MLPQEWSALDISYLTMGKQHRLLLGSCSPGHTTGSDHVITWNGITHKSNVFTVGNQAWYEKDAKDGGSFAVFMRTWRLSKVCKLCR